MQASENASSDRARTTSRPWIYRGEIMGGLRGDPVRRGVGLRAVKVLTVSFQDQGFGPGNLNFKGGNQFPSNRWVHCRN
jgi:hypothetical protein